MSDGQYYVLCCAVAAGWMLTAWMSAGWVWRRVKQHRAHHRPPYDWAQDPAYAIPQFRNVRVLP